MHALILKEFTKAEDQRKAILNQLSLLDVARLNNRPNQKWSAAQIISHIIESERISILYMKKKSLGIADAGDTGIWEWLKFSILKFSQRLPLRFKAPSVLGENDPATLPLDELVSQWSKTRAQLASFLETLDEKTLRRKIYKHPVVGKLNVLQAIAFMREHVSHHLPQIHKRTA